MENENIQLYHGDCIKVMSELFDKGVKVDAIIADPPYGITNCKWDEIIPLDVMWYWLKKIRKNISTPIILFGNEPYSSTVRLSNVKEYKYDWKWEKTNATGFFNVKKQPLRNIEDLMVFYGKQCIYNYIKTEGHKPVNSYTRYKDTSNKTDVYGKVKVDIKGGGNTDRYPKQLLTFKSDKQTNKLHSTQKPLALLEYMVKTYTNEGDLVLDFCMGSGTAGEACKKNNRRFIGIEKEEYIFNVAKERIENNGNKTKNFNT